MIMDESRGYLLESLIAKLRFIEKVKGKRVQIVALSATMGGIDKLQEWLDCAIYQCSFRPVPLNEYYLGKDGKLRIADKTVLDIKSLVSPGRDLL